MKVLKQTAFSAGVAALALCMQASAAEEVDADPVILDAAETTLEEWLWIKRPLVIFADSPADPRFVEQMELVEDRIDSLIARDVIVVTDTDPAARSDARTTLRPRGFMLVVLAKDGTVVIRKPAPWDVREISRSIDKLPLRRQEIRSAPRTDSPQ